MITINIDTRLYSSVIDEFTQSSCVHIISELVLTSPKFLQMVTTYSQALNNKVQFYDNSGLQILSELGIFSNFSAVETIISALQIVSQLARNSEAYFNTIMTVFNADLMCGLLKQVQFYFV